MKKLTASIKKKVNKIITKKRVTKFNKEKVNKEIKSNDKFI